MKDKLKLKIEVKAVKYMPGHDADAMSCNLYVNGKKAAAVFDDSWSGGYIYSEVDEELFAIFDKHVKALPPINVKDLLGTKEDSFMEESHDTVIGSLVDKFEFDKAERAMVRRSKTHTLFRLDSENYGSHEFRYIEAPCSDKIVGFITKKYGNNVIIFNVHGKWPVKTSTSK